MLPAMRSYLTALILLLLCGTGLARAQGALPTATLTVNGAEQQQNGSWDSGNIQVDFNGFVEVVNYGEYSTNASLASALAAMFVRDFHSFGLYAKAAANGTGLSVVTFQLTNGNTFGPLNVVDHSLSFTLVGSGFSSSSATTADIGIATLTIQNLNQTSQTYTYQVNYGNGSNAASIAQDLTVQAAKASASGAPVSVTSEGPNLYLQVKQPTGSFNYSYSLSFSTNVSFASSTPATGNLTGSTDVAPITVYSYSIANGSGSGYQPNGNVQNLSDSVMGNWTYGYDSLNRLISGTVSGEAYSGESTCWSYDSFGNRLSQSVSSTACGSNPSSTFAATYSAANQISSVTTPSGRNITYDPSGVGNMTSDGVNTYTYDAEGRVCALNGPQGMIGYQYDANGNRVGKGTVTTISTCDIASNGYKPITDYVLDQSGAQMTEMAISVTGNGTQSTWVHSNVAADGVLIATYDTTGYGLHFYLSDILGSRRVQTDSAGIPEQTCQSLPFGDQLYCTGSLTSPTEHHFTGKERDTESGLDYFGARYYASMMGRFSSPDPSGLEYADPGNPQTLNLYSYVSNQVTIHTDPDGLSWFTHTCNGSTPQALSLGIRIYNFFSNLTCGGGGGGDSSPDPGFGGGLGGTSASKLGRAELNRRVTSITTSFTKTNCGSVYRKVGQQLGIPFSTKAFGAALRRNIVEKPFEHDDEDAFARTQRKGDPGPNNNKQITLYSNFYTDLSPDQQNGSMAHEETHAYFGMGDYQRDGPPNFDDAFAKYGYNRGSGSSHLLDSWLMSGCPASRQ